MVKKHKGCVIKTAGRMIVIFLFFGAIISTLSYTLFRNLYKVGELNEELEVLDAKMNGLLEEECALNGDIKRLSDPMYVARYAREKYFYSKEGEIVLRFDD